MANPDILVIDPDEGFGMMLKSGLEGTGYYNVTWVDTALKGLEALRDKSFDLAIIDVAINDIAPPKLVYGIRKLKGEKFPILMIPYFGEDLPDTLKKLNLTGVLSKPFFVGDLPDIIDEAMGRPRSQRPVIPPPGSSPPPADSTAKKGDEQPKDKAKADNAAKDQPPGEQKVAFTKVIQVPQETIRYLRANETEVLRILDDLNREVRAEAILLIAGTELIAQAGILGRDQCKELTELVAQSSQAAAEAAKFLGEPEKRFAQSMHEGSEYRLYSLSLGEGILLSLALSLNVPLGMIRHQCRQAAEQLSQFII